MEFINVAPNMALDITLIEDDEAVRASLAFALQVEGFTVHAFANAEAMLSPPWAPKCACLIIDYWLPGMNGLALLARLRAAGLGTPAIVITTNASSLLRERARGLGAQVIEKPLLDDAVVRTVRDITRVA